MAKAVYHVALRLISRSIRSGLTGLCALLPCVANALPGIDTNVDICGQPATFPYVSAGYVADEKQDIDGGLGEVEQVNTAFDLMLRPDDRWSFGVGHRYAILKVDPLEAETNGHLHTLFFPLHWQSRSESGSFRASIAPAISTSSNILKDPGQYSADALQFLAALEWAQSLATAVNLRYGICGDHRFGNYRIYPLVSVDWQPNSDWAIEVGFPTLQARYRISSRFSSSVRFTPDGNEWHVADKSLENESRLVYEAYLLEWTLSWQASRSLALTASVGRQYQNRYEMTLRDGSQVQLSSEPSTRIGAALLWRF